LIGSDQISTGAGSDDIDIAQAWISPVPSLPATGSLMINSGNGNDNINVNRILAGSVTILAGNGNDRVALDDSSVQQADITVGTETNGAVGSNRVDVSRDLITGAHVNLNVFNESGVRGVRANGSAGISPGSVNHVTMNDVLFTAGGDLNVRVDDGIVYYDFAENEVIEDGGSSIILLAIQTGGNVNVQLGDHFQFVLLGAEAEDPSVIVANTLTLSVGNDVDIVIVNAQITESESVTLGDNSPYPTTLVGGDLPPPSVTVSGTVGDDLSDSLMIAIGSNINRTEPSGWPLTVTETDAGSLSIGPNPLAASMADNGLAVTIDPTSVGNVTDVTLGSGGVNQQESLMMMNVMSGTSDPTISLNSNPGDTVRIDLTNVQCLVDDANLVLTDSGQGIDLVNLLNVTVDGTLEIILTDNSGNVVKAKNVHSGSPGFIETGGTYVDEGGNSGFTVNPPPGPS
jgi:hypothetical protein